METLSRKTLRLALGTYGHNGSLRGVMINRRTLIVALGAGALIAPFISSAQTQAKVWRVGYLALASGEDVAPTMVAFKERLRELGYIDGKNLLFEYRSAE